jgi:hypothetical protein
LHPQTQAALGHYKDAEDHFMAIQSEEVKNEFSFYSWHCRTREFCFGNVFCVRPSALGIN